MATTLAPTRLRDMTAVSKDGEAEPLGYIVWYSVPDEDVSLRRVKKFWLRALLDPKPLPPNPREIDAFKRAVRAEEGRITLPNGDIMETDVRDIPSNDSFVTYQISRVVKDRDEKLVQYPKALRVKYNRYTSEVDYDALGEVPRRDVLPIMEAISARFEANASTITGPKVRALIRTYLTDTDDEQEGMVGLGAEEMSGPAGNKGKGVYFVLAKYADQIEGLSQFLSALHADGRAYLYAVPMADGATEREMIRRQHNANSIAEIEDAIGEVRELLREDRKRGVRDNVRKHHFRKLERLKRHAAEYAEALEEEQEDLNMHLEVLHKQLRKLLGA